MPGQAAEQSAVLCTPDKTFNLRQVNTSNSLFVTKLSDGPQDEIPKPQLEAISQSNFTLELQAANDVSAASHIQAILPVYASTGHYQSSNPISKAVLFSHIPASESECEKAWRDLACFELDGEALVPSASVKTLAWRAIFDAATEGGIDLTAPLHEKQQSTLTDVNASQWPQETSLALLRSVSGTIEANELLLDEKKCARMVGQALLKDRAGRTAVAKATFTADWADRLPEKWRGSAQLSLLEGYYKTQDGGIMFHDGVDADTDASTPGGKAPAEAKSALGAKRKWHEKFRASKKTA